MSAVFDICPYMNIMFSTLVLSMCALSATLLYVWTHTFQRDPRYVLQKYNLKHAVPNFHTNPYTPVAMRRTALLFMANDLSTHARETPEKDITAQCIAFLAAHDNFEQTTKTYLAMRKMDSTVCRNVVLDV